jgi:hypothetical protein
MQRQVRYRPLQPAVLLLELLPRHPNPRFGLPISHDRQYISAGAGQAVSFKACLPPHASFNGVATLEHRLPGKG